MARHPLYRGSLYQGLTAYLSCRIPTVLDHDGWFSCGLRNMTKSGPQTAIRREALRPRRIPPLQWGSLISYTPCPPKKRRREKKSTPKKRHRKEPCLRGPGPPSSPFTASPRLLHSSPPSQRLQRSKLGGLRISKKGQHCWRRLLVPKERLYPRGFHPQAFPTLLHAL